jgi:hypothetical protein
VPARKELDWSVYRLAKAVKPHISERSVYEFLAGEKLMSADNLGHLLDAIDLQITVKEKRRK